MTAQRWASARYTKALPPCRRATPDLVPCIQQPRRGPQRYSDGFGFGRPGCGAPMIVIVRPGFAGTIVQSGGIRSPIDGLSVLLPETTLQPRRYIGSVSGTEPREIAPTRGIVTTYSRLGIPSRSGTSGVTRLLGIAPASLQCQRLPAANLLRSALPVPSPSEQRHKIEARCSENGWQLGLLRSA